MKKIVQIFIIILLATNTIKAQNQIYWAEGFEPDASLPSSCNLSTSAPTVTGGSYFAGNIGSWYGFNVYRTTGTGCPTGNNHVRYKNISGVTDSGYLVTPTVNFGIKELHFLRARASRSFTIWSTTDTTATTTNWTMVALMPSSSLTVVCTDTTVLINSATAKRLKIVGRPGTDSDVDSIYITSFNAITPVKFGGINLSQTNGLVKLSWNVLQEINTLKYEIERSTNGKDFSVVGALTALQVDKYNFVDNTPNAGTSYYRIKAIDKDGALTYSSIVKFSSKKQEASILVSPNPVTDGKINLQLNNFTKGTYAIMVYNVAGKQVYTKQLSIEEGFSNQYLELASGIQKGIYQLQISNATTKIIKAVVVQ